MSDTGSRPDVTALTVELLSAYLANNTVASEDLAGLIRTTRSALIDEPSPAPVVEEAYVPAVTARKSLASPEHILSLIDGKPYKALKRHLARHGLTPQSYRERYNLPATYPMVAPNFAAKRREIAQKIGLGARRAPETANARAAQSMPAAEELEAGLTKAKAKRNVAKPGKLKAASSARPRQKVAPDGGATAVAPESQAENEKPGAAKSRTAPKKASASSKKGTRSAAKAKPGTAAQSLASPDAQPSLSKRNMLKGDAKKTSDRAGKSSARAHAKTPAGANTQVVAEPSANAEPVSAEKPPSTRRAKLGLFGGGAAEPAGNGTASGNVAPQAGSEAGTALRAPRAKRMARLPATSSGK